jgi:hypothetical protein
MPKVAVLQSNYIPWKGYFDLIHDVDIFCFYDEVQYTKNDWRNRNKIYSKNGLQWLSIPINKDAVKLKISEVQLPLSWRDKHKSAIKMSYNRAACIGNLDMLLTELYEEGDFRYLSEFNQYSIKRIADFLGIKTQFINSAHFELKGDRVARLISLLKQIGATEYISGPAAKDYLEGSEHLFEEASIRLVYKEYGNYPPYKQLREPFENYVSILDLVANVEKNEIPKYIWEWRKQ